MVRGRTVGDLPSRRVMADLIGAQTYAHKTNAHKTNAHKTNAHNTNGKRDICSQLFL